MSTHEAVSTPVVYTADSQVRDPFGLVRAIWRDLRASRELSWRLFVRDVSAQYRQSLLGVVWAFIPPLVTSLIFIALQSRRLVDFGDIAVPYPIYVVVGTILWQMVVESVNAPLKVVTAAKPMLAKISFPRESLLVAAFYTVLYGAAIKLGVILGFLMLYGMPLSTTLPLALGPVLLLILCGFTVGLLLTPIGLLYTDIASGLPVVTQLLFFVTPVVYAPPQTFPFSLIGVVNPVSPALIAARDLLTQGTVFNLMPVVLVGGLTALGLFVGLVLYRLALPIIIERISA